MTNATPLAVYIHWPFCKSKCPYCDFNSHVRENVETQRWERALLAELEYMAARLPAHYAVSIFFGGGTPSLMPPRIVAALIERVKQLFPGPLEPEITLEANPTSVEAANFQLLRQAGVNRVSLGVQSLREEGLAFLGREHSAAEALAAVELAAEVFPRYSFDLIYARPGQTPHDWEHELREALPYIGTHASMYQLTIEEETPFARFYAAGDFSLPPEEDAAVMYEQTAAILGEIGLQPYEISNYAAPVAECFHNLEIWRGTPYLGIGPGAHGRVEGREWKVGGSGQDSLDEYLLTTPHSLLATNTLKSPERWLSHVEREGHGLESVTPVSSSERFEERLLMGMRLSDGVDLTTLPCQQKAEALLRHNVVKQLQKLGVMEIYGTRIRLTAKGRLVLDSIVAQLLTA